MLKFIFFSAIIPLAGIAGLRLAGSSTMNLLEVRPDPWPINLQRTINRRDTSYALEFRDQQVLNGVMLDTLPFANLEQLRFFEQGLTALKKGNTGDVADYKNYSIKRTDIRKEPTWYLLRFEGGLTNFQQPEADKMITLIKGL